MSETEKTDQLSILERKLLEAQELERECRASLRKKVTELEKENDFLRRQNIIDNLTGIHNRKFFDEEFPKEVLEAKRREETVSIVMIDIDNFKKFNDTYGHQKGDEVLQLVAQTLENILKRPTDSVSRYGGEEFVFILPNTDMAGAGYIAEKARGAVESLEIRHSASNGVVTLSLGTATLLSDESASQLLERADENLYEAKNCGRNRVFCG
jgi:diguanylate cyclase (GGDEF)-like protein